MDDIADRWALAHVTSSLWFWIWASVLVYVLTSNALWFVNAIWRSPRRFWAVQVGRFFLFLAIPYLALGGWPRQPYQGLLSLEDMGLVGLGGRWSVTRWLGTAGTGLGWGLIALVVLALAWANANQRTHGVWLRFSTRSWWLVLVDVLFLEVHWGFYRSALAVTLGDIYAGIFLGVGLVYLEWSLNPFWRQGWPLETQAATRWLRAALVLIVALLFFLTRNLWICFLVHWLLEVSLRYLGREQVPTASAQLLDIP